MKTTRTLFFLLVMCCSLLTFGSAFADAGGGSITGDVNVQLPSGMTGLVMLALVALNFLLPWATKTTTGKLAAFVHSRTGALVISAVMAVIPGALQVVQSHGLDWRAIQAAVYTGLLAFMTSRSPSNTGAEQKAKVLAMRFPSNKPTMPASKQAGFMHLKLMLGFALITLGLLLVGAFAGCATLKTCELSKLPSEEQAAIADASAIVTTGAADWEVQLVQLGIAVGQAQLSCLIQAIETEWSKTKAAVSPERQAAIARLNQYLKDHPTAGACAHTNFPTAPTPTTVNHNSSLVGMLGPPRDSRARSGALSARL